MNSDLAAIARRLEREGKRLEARALRSVAAAYGNLSLADLIALVGAVSERPSAIARIAGANQLMDAFDRAVAVTQQAPDDLLLHLRGLVVDGIGAFAEMLTVQRAAPAVIDAFRVRPDAEISYTRHAAERLARYWGTEQERLRQEVQSALLEGLERGQSVQQIQARLRERVQVSRSRAGTIVRNELGNASAFAQRESQEEAGITQYIWHTAGDDRVRPEHRARNGKTFSWDDPPSDGHPGQPIMCRCVALAVLPEEFR